MCNSFLYGCYLSMTWLLIDNVHHSMLDFHERLFQALYNLFHTHLLLIPFLWYRIQSYITGHCLYYFAFVKQKIKKAIFKLTTVTLALLYLFIFLIICSLRFTFSSWTCMYCSSYSVSGCSEFAVYTYMH